jgi:hypothetical protein
MQQPTIGRIVHYTLNAGDVTLIDRHSPRIVDGRTVRNDVRAGQAYPAQVVAVFGSGSTANLIVQLDGEGQHWATSRQVGDGEGQWAWPPRV